MNNWVNVVTNFCFRGTRAERILVTSLCDISASGWYYFQSERLLLKWDFSNILVGWDYAGQLPQSLIVGHGFRLTKDISCTIYGEWVYVLLLFLFLGNGEDVSVQTEMGSIFTLTARGRSLDWNNYQVDPTLFNHGCQRLIQTNIK